jgi:hypothetical protein
MHRLSSILTSNMDAASTRRAIYEILSLPSIGMDSIDSIDSDSERGPRPLGEERSVHSSGYHSTHSSGYSRDTQPVSAGFRAYSNGVPAPSASTSPPRPHPHPHPHPQRQWQEVSRPAADRPSSGPLSSSSSLSLSGFMRQTVASRPKRQSFIASQQVSKRRGCDHVA